MYKIILLTLIAFSIISCKKDNDNDGEYTFTATVKAFDLNCEICVLEFPNDSLTVKRLVGEIPYSNLYNAVNLNMDDFVIGQNLVVTLRKPQGDEIKGCITLYVSYTNQNIFITKYQKI